MPKECEYSKWTKAHPTFNFKTRDKQRPGAPSNMAILKEAIDGMDWQEHPILPARLYAVQVDPPDNIWTALGGIFALVTDEHTSASRLPSNMLLVNDIRAFRKTLHDHLDVYAWDQPGVGRIYHLIHKDKKDRGLAIIVQLLAALADDWFAGNCWDMTVIPKTSDDQKVCRLGYTMGARRGQLGAPDGFIEDALNNLDPLEFWQNTLAGWNNPMKDRLIRAVANIPSALNATEDELYDLEWDIFNGDERAAEIRKGIRIGHDIIEWIGNGFTFPKHPKAKGIPRHWFDFEPCTDETGQLFQET